MYFLCLHTDKKEKKIFLIYKEIQKGAVAKSYMRRGFLIYEKMRKYLVIYEEAVCHIWLCNRSLLVFLINEENFVFFFISALYKNIQLYISENEVAKPGFQILF